MNRREFVGSGLALGAVALIHPGAGTAEPAAHKTGRDKRLITLNAKPRPLELDLNKTAVVEIGPYEKSAHGGDDAKAAMILLSLRIENNSKFVARQEARNGRHRALLPWRIQR